MEDFESKHNNYGDIVAFNQNLSKDQYIFAHVFLF